MGYTHKLQNNAVVGTLFVHMAQRNHSEDRDRATEPKFYLPAGVTLPLDASRFERFWATLFSQRPEPSK